MIPQVKSATIMARSRLPTTESPGSRLTRWFSRPVEYGGNLRNRWRGWRLLYLDWAEPVRARGLWKRR